MKDVLQVRNEYRLQQWNRIIQEYQNSGLSNMVDLSRVSRYYVACGHTDLRRGIDDLVAIVSQQFGKGLREDSLFLVCGRRADRIKALYYAEDGYVL